MLSLGERRLKDVHKRVDYLLDKFMYNELKHVQVFDLCKFCETVEVLDMSVPMKERKQIYLNCSGIDWICHARYDVNNYRGILWNQYTLMSSEDYSQLVMEAMNTMEPRHALDAVHHLNKELKVEQPHMVNTIHAVEELLYSCYVPMQLKGDTLPLPPLGKEYEEEFVAPEKFNLNEMEPRFKEVWISSCSCTEKCLDPETEKCTTCGNSKLKLAREALKCNDFAPEMPKWDKFLEFLDEERLLINGSPNNTSQIQENLNMARVRTLVNSTCTDILTHLNALTGIKDPCNFCKNLKRSTPDRVVDCSGLLKVCTFRYDFFKEWPVSMVRDKCYNDRVLNCNTTERYKHLLNEIFSLKYLERAMKVKDIVDDDILAANPHLAPVIKQYNALLYRYYWPCALEKKVLDLGTDTCPSSPESQCEERYI